MWRPIRGTKRRGQEAVACTRHYWKRSTGIDSVIFQEMVSEWSIVEKLREYEKLSQGEDADKRAKL